MRFIRSRPVICVLANLVLVVLTLTTLLWASLAAPLHAADAPRPNIVLILADDLGWGHVGWQNPKVKTPHLDQLAKAGVQLNRHYVAPVCSPTRVALLTGRYWSRFGCINALPSELDSTVVAMPPGTPTLGASLQAVGYRTALIGKWHLGATLESGPEKFGFDFFYGLRVGGMTPLSHQWLGEGKSALWRNGKVVDEPGHLTDLLAREAVAWLGKDSRQPFFLYLAFTSPHVPLSEPEPWLGLYKNSGADLSHQLYWAAISHLDEAVGKVVAEVDRLGQRDNTMFIFLSDNGAPGQPNRMQVKQDLESYPKLLLPGDNLPFRGKKGDVYEGGIRTPGLVYWPDKLQPGVCEVPLSITDWMPTLCALAGNKPQRDLKWDGDDIFPTLTGSTPHPASRVLYCKGPDHQSAVSDGHWKLIVTRKAVELYNLTEDIGEKNDLAAQHPEVVQQLRAKLDIQAAKDNDAVPNRTVPPIPGG
jgi:arylsulfatase A-like enzyme